MKNITATEEQALQIVHRYTIFATGTGAVPVPAASAAIAAETGAMIAHIASTMGMPISVSTVIKSISLAGSLNIVGRTLFIEGARLLSAATGGFFTPAVMALGAATAGLQTYIIGLLAIEIVRNGGNPLPKEVTQQIKEYATQSYKSFIEA